MPKEQILKEFEKFPIDILKHTLAQANRLYKQQLYFKTAEYAKLKEEEEKKKEDFREMWLNSPG